MKMRRQSRSALMLLCAGCLSFSSPGSIAQDNSLSIGSIRTEAKNAAVGFLMKYKENLTQDKLQERWSPDAWTPGQTRSGFTFFTPEVEFQSGENDAFNGLVINVQGTRAIMDVTCIVPTVDADGNEGERRGNCAEPMAIPVLDTGNLFHAFPFSVGLESNSSFDTVNLLAEVGYVPFKLNSAMQWGLSNKVGLFLQGGYKLEVDDNPGMKIGGAVDESMEDPDDSIARVKGIMEFSLPIAIADWATFYFEPMARVWYDLKNSEVYHKSEIKIRFDLTETYSFDLKYENGSGAPNYNEGDQFSANLSLKF